MVGVGDSLMHEGPRTYLGRGGGCGCPARPGTRPSSGLASLIGGTAGQADGQQSGGQASYDSDPYLAASF